MDISISESNEVVLTEQIAHILDFNALDSEIQMLQDTIKMLQISLNEKSALRDNAQTVLSKKIEKMGGPSPAIEVKP